MKEKRKKEIDAAKTLIFIKKYKESFFFIFLLYQILKYLNSFGEKTSQIKNISNISSQNIWTWC